MVGPLVAARRAARPTRLRGRHSPRPTRGRRRCSAAAPIADPVARQRVSLAKRAIASHVAHAAARAFRGGTLARSCPSVLHSFVRSPAGGVCVIGPRLPSPRRRGEDGVARQASRVSAEVPAARPTPHLRLGHRARLAPLRRGARMEPLPLRAHHRQRERHETTLALLAECFEELGGVPEGGTHRSHGMPARRHRRQRRRAPSGVRALRRALRVPPRLL
jgi:hypothetical protein